MLSEVARLLRRKKELGMVPVLSSHRIRPILTSFAGFKSYADPTISHWDA